jgi:hypothetical protein
MKAILLPLSFPIFYQGEFSPTPKRQIIPLAYFFNSNVSFKKRRKTTKKWKLEIECFEFELRGDNLFSRIIYNFCSF